MHTAKAITNISTESKIDGKLKKLLNHFNEAEVVDLTIVIFLMNSLNRLAIGFGDRPSNRNI